MAMCIRLRFWTTRGLALSGVCALPLTVNLPGLHSFLACPSLYCLALFRASKLRYSTIISPFITSQWPGKVQMKG